MIQLKNATSKLQKVSEIQNHQQKQTLLENDKSIKVSQTQLHPSNELIHSTNNKMTVAMASSVRGIDSVKPTANFPEKAYFRRFWDIFSLLGL